MYICVCLFALQFVSLFKSMLFRLSVSVSLSLRERDRLIQKCWEKKEGSWLLILSVYALLNIWAEAPIDGTHILSLYHTNTVLFISLSLSLSFQRPKMLFSQCSIEIVARSKAPPIQIKKKFFSSFDCWIGETGCHWGGKKEKVFKFQILYLLMLKFDQRQDLIWEVIS